MFVYLFFDRLIVLSGCTWDWVSELNVVALNLQVLGRVLEVEGRPSGTWGWIADSNEDSGLQRLTVPQSLLGSIASPLNAEETNKYLNQLNDHTLRHHGQDDDFCKVARLECNSDVEIVGMSRINPVDQESFEHNRDSTDIMLGNKFNHNDINKGNEIVLPENLHDSHPIVPFLPQSLSEKLPFSRYSTILSMNSNKLKLFRV